MLTHFEAIRCSEVIYSFKSQLTDVFPPHVQSFVDYKQRLKPPFSTAMFIYLSKKVSTAASAAAQPLIERGLSSHWCVCVCVRVDRSPFPTTSTSSVSPGTKIKASLPVGATMVCSGCSSWKRSLVISHPSVRVSIDVSANLFAEVCVWRLTTGPVAPPDFALIQGASWRHLKSWVGT